MITVSKVKTCLLALLLFLFASFSSAQLPYTEKQVVAYAKSIDVHMLDPSLPSQRLEDWLQSGPPHAHIGYWSLEETCDLKEPDAPYPVCARITFYREGRDGERYGQQGILLIQVGNSRDGIVGRPKLFYPSIDVWEGTMVMTGGAERLSDLPALLDQPVITGGVQKLYAEIVAHHPIGIPTSAEMAVIRPFLSKRLASSFKRQKSVRTTTTVNTPYPGEFQNLAG